MFSELFYLEFHHQLCAVVDAVEEGFVFVGCAEAAAKVENSIVVLQRQPVQKGIQFLEAVPYVRWVGFVGFLVCPEQLVQYCFAIRIADVKGAGLQMVLEQIYD